MANGISVQLKGIDKLCKNLNKINAKAENVIKKSMNDMKSRAPAWVSQEVSNEYTIKKAEVKSASRVIKQGTTKIGGGIAVDSIALEYKGSSLSPTHFKTKPKKPSTVKQKGKLIPGEGTTSGSDVVSAEPLKAQKITMEVHKGKQKVVTGKYGTGAFLGGTGAKYIPFQRKSEGRLPIEAIKTTSIPQMVDNPEVNEKIHKKIDEELSKRIHHHLERELNR